MLSYKTHVIREYDKANQNHIYFDSLPKVRIWLLETTHVTAEFARSCIAKPLCERSIKNVIFIKRGAIRLVDDMKYGRRKLGDMIEKKGTASGYMQTIIDQKKKIRKKAHKQL